MLLINNNQYKTKIMKHNTKNLVAGGLVGATLMIAGSAFAAISEEAKEAIANNDFEAFQAAVEDTRAADLPEEIFDLKVDLYEAKEGSDEDEVAEIKAELKEYKSEQKAQRQATRADRRSAVESGDYDAFVALVPAGRDVPSQEVFGLLGDLHDAREAEDDEAKTEIKAELKELGFEKPERKHKGERGQRGGNR